MLTLFSLLFIWSFLSATILPLGVEPYFMSVVSQSNQVVWPVIIASTGNSLGGLTILLMGIAGNQWLIRQLNGEKKTRLDKLTAFVRKYGNPVLLLSWVPFLGDVLVMLVGLSKPEIRTAILYLVVGKTARFITLGWLTSELHFLW